MKRTWLSIGAAVAIAVSVAATAHADSMNVVAAIKAQDAHVRHLPGYQTFEAGLNVKTVSQAKKVVPVIGAIETASVHATHIVARASTSTAKQRQGQADWVKGSDEADQGISEYRTALKDLIAGNHSAFKNRRRQGTKAHRRWRDAQLQR